MSEVFKYAVTALDGRVRIGCYDTVASIYDVISTFLDDGYALSDLTLEVTVQGKSMCELAMEHLVGQGHRWQDCPVYQEG